MNHNVCIWFHWDPPFRKNVALPDIFRTNAVITPYILTKKIRKHGNKKFQKIIRRKAIVWEAQNWFQIWNTTNIYRGMKFWKKSPPPFHFGLGTPLYIYIYIYTSFSYRDGWAEHVTVKKMTWSTLFFVETLFLCVIWFLDKKNSVFFFLIFFFKNCSK